MYKWLHIRGILSANLSVIIRYGFLATTKPNILFAYYTASQSIVWYLLCEITDTILPIITGISTDTNTDTGIGPPLLLSTSVLNDIHPSVYEIYQYVHRYIWMHKYTPYVCVDCVTILVMTIL